MSGVPPPKTAFSGASALEYTKRVTALGARPCGSEAHRKLEQMLRTHIKAHGWELTEQTWTASTPGGPIPMSNFIANRRGQPGARAVVFTGHYDTKLMPGINFVGANDGGSSTGALMELARVLAARPLRDDLYLVWLDGEEAVAQWTESDSLYGSRHLAEAWAAERRLRDIKALINIDMIGDRDLDLVAEMYSTAWLRNLVWQTAREVGHGRYFTSNEGWIGDDHLPFLARGVPSLDLIDFTYGPQNAFWHTERDTMDKLSANSFQVIGDVLVAALQKLEAQGNP